MTPLPAVSARAAILLAAALWTAVAVLGPQGPMTIDEAAYLAAARALTADGSFFFENPYIPMGVPHFGSSLLIERPEGFTPQYPPGQAILFAPLMAMLGPLGLILSNVASAVGVLVLTRALTLRLTGNAEIAATAVLLMAFAGFLGDYAISIWPHASSALAVLAAVHLVAGAVLWDQKRAGMRVALAGLVIGLGIMLRVDAVLAVPPLAVWLLATAERPWSRAFQLGAGLVPGLAALAVLNGIKFDIWFPVSYGGQSGSISLLGYLPFALVAAVGVVLALVIRTAEGRRRAAPFIALAGIAGVVAAVLVPKIGYYALRFLDGVHVLILDLTQSGDPRADVIDGPGGTKNFFGRDKKALLQSLPWLGILTVLIGARSKVLARPALMLLLLVPLLWMTPFLLRAWHGGLSNSLRYFLPVVPLLTILGAVAWAELRARAGGLPVPRRLVVIGILGAAVLASVSLLIPGDLAVLQQRMTHPLAIGLMVLAGLSALGGARGQSFARLARGLGAVALALAAIYGLVLDPARTIKGQVSGAAAWEQAYGPGAETPSDP